MRQRLEIYLIVHSWILHLLRVHYISVKSFRTKLRKRSLSLSANKRGRCEKKTSISSKRIINLTLLLVYRDGRGAAIVEFPCSHKLSAFSTTDQLIHIRGSITLVFNLKTVESYTKSNKLLFYLFLVTH